MNLHENTPKEVVNKVFASQPLDPRGGDSNPSKPQGFIGYFGLPMVNPNRLLLPPNIAYHWPLNYFEYVQDSNLDVHVIMFKIAIKVNSETNDA
jgi:hypothetical protein